MSSEPSIFFADPNERQGSFLRRTLMFGGLSALGVTALVGRLGDADFAAKLAAFVKEILRIKAAAKA